MASDRPKQFEDSLTQLDAAIARYGKGLEPTGLDFLALIKAFEIAVEKVWKWLKMRVEDEGLHAPSPKETIRQAAKIGLIRDASLWLEFINVRNKSVHNYYDLPIKDVVAAVKTFLTQAQQL